MNKDRVSHIAEFYQHLDRLEHLCGGARRLVECHGRMGWPHRGVYFFREPGEDRSDSGRGPRVVRIGTHALKSGSQTSIWNRLSQHRGTVSSGGGNHRGSIFRLIVGAALMHRDGQSCATWGQGSNAPRLVREKEQAIEQQVSKQIGDMPFVWLAIDDEAGSDSLRGHIERNSIALLSDTNKKAIDSATDGWLGNSCDRQKVRESGLWNQNHVNERYDPAFLDVFEELIGKMARST